MDVHTPKQPIQSWRELAKEIGIIVVGVLIALGAEQALSVRSAAPASRTSPFR
jgi:hypothetical protein